MEINEQDPKIISKPKGKYISTTGRRKTAVARVRLYKKGTGIVLVNDMKSSEYFTPGDASVAKQPLKLTSHLRDVDITVVVSGSGKISQAEAVRHGIAQALVEMDPEIRAVIKSKDWLTRDSRKKERKKPGLKKARRAPQWAKR